MKHSILSFLTFFLLVVFSACNPARKSISDSVEIVEKPNILFIFADDLGKEWISSYGAEEIETPRIDDLARNGLMFENFYAMPQCTPSRVSLFTGQYPFRHGWVNHWDVPRWGGGAHFDPDTNPSFARILQSAGYKNAAAGKWQVNDFRVQPEIMKEHGFDDYCMWTGYETGNPPSAERYWDPYIHTKSGSKTYHGQFGEDVFVDFLIDFMGKNKNGPIFLYYSMCLPHTPLTTTPAEPVVSGNIERHKAMVRYIDILVGRLEDALVELGLRENTIIIFATDNGSTIGITGLRNGREVKGGKQKTTENGICVPFIVNCPGMIPEGKVTNALSDITDIFPTFVELANAEVPDNIGIDGVSQAKVFTGATKDSQRDWIMAMGGGNNAALSKKGVENQYRFRDRVIRDKKYKLFVSSERKPEKLVNLKADPEEKNNLLPANTADTRKALRKLWKVDETFPEKDNDPIYNPLPPESWDVDITVESEVWKK
ncbi:MAG: sulfatase-like hydrolase/transferase [Bacteroidales bacterium]|nr:sulfatase-like hydrolase/transferase [Bacteroidales bacterium]